MEQNDKINFTEGSIVKKLLLFSFPILLTLFLQALYGAVDLMIVGKFADTADMSAVATGSMIMSTYTYVLINLATGITVMVGQKLGEGKPQVASRVIGVGIYIFLFVTTACTILYVATANPMAQLMQAPTEAFDKTVAYVQICSAGTVFIVAYNVLGSIFRGIGDSNMPLITVAIASVLNVGGDLLLVKGFSMGAEGAALATILAQAFSVLISFLIIKRRKLPFVFSKKDICHDKALEKDILKIGIPLAAQDLLVSISFLVIMGIVNSLSVEKSAGVGAAEKLCAFVMLIPAAYSQSMSAFVAQNIGANKPKRANKALWTGILISLITGIMIAYVSFFHGDLLSRIFTDNEVVIKESADYLKGYAIDCLFCSFLFCFIGYFCGKGQSTFSMIQGIMGAFCFRIPFAFLMFSLGLAEQNLFFISLASPVSTVVQIVVCLVYFFITKKKEKLLYEGNEY